MKNFYDVQQLLKSYGVIIYMQSRKQHLDLIEFEMRELYRSDLVPREEFTLAIAIINQERQYS